jgi:hypothetical protein
MLPPAAPVPSANAGRRRRPGSVLVAELSSLVAGSLCIESGQPPFRIKTCDTVTPGDDGPGVGLLSSSAVRHACCNMVGMRTAAIVIGALLLGGCESAGRIVPLLSTSGVPLTAPTTVPLRVVTRSTAVHDPLPMRGSDVTNTDVESALGHAIASATVPWASQHRSHPESKDGWQLSVEVINADAQYEGGRVIFSLAVRATLRGRAGNVYLAQTQASCRQGAIALPDSGGPVMYKCMTEIGRDLDGWLEGVDLEAVAAAP